MHANPDRKETTMTWTARTLATLGAIALCSIAMAQDSYPRQSIKMVVTFPPGGSADTIVRMLVPKLNEDLGQSVVVENRPGAGGNIGMGLVAQSPPDGYTMGVGAAGALSANSSLYSQMPFDARKDFRGVTLLAAIPFVLVGNPSVPARTVGELVAFAKEKPGALSVAHGGNGTAMHLSTALFSQMAGIRVTEVPYRGSAPAAMDAISGQVMLAMVDLPSSLQHIRAGKLVAYAVTSPQRLTQLPDVPTMSEAGLPGYDSTGWFGVVTPAGTPPTVISRMNAAITAALRDPDIQGRMRDSGVEPSPSSPDAFEAYIAAETEKWADVIRQANIRIN
jgi:tripartite-type tricarboxylate transporter receptor subunit TctC